MMPFFIHKNNRSFTLMELIVVVIIVSVLASLAIPNLFKSVEQNYEMDAMIQLRSIYNVEQVFLTRTGGFWPTELTIFAYVDTINDDLALSVLPNGFTYLCSNNPSGDGPVCTAERENGQYRIKIRHDQPLTPYTSIFEDTGPNPCCDLTPCPRLGPCL